MLKKNLLLLSFSLILAIMFSGVVAAANSNSTNSTMQLVPSPNNSSTEVQSMNYTSSQLDPINNRTGIHYDTIQSAINSVLTKDGDTIICNAGTYNEDVLVSKNLTILGESSKNTFVNSFHITNSGSGTVISNFSLTGGSGEAITLQDANNCEINDNVISGGYSVGIALVNSDSNNIYGNIIDNSLAANYYGIYFENSSENLISHNAIRNSTRDGIWIQNSVMNNIEFNEVTNNALSGINIDSSNNNQIQANGVSYNHNGGIIITNSLSNKISGNQIFNNTLGNGITLVNANSTLIEINNIFNNTNNTNGTYEGCGIAVLGSNNVRISTNNLYGSFSGIEIKNSSNDLVENNSAYNNDDAGISAYNSTGFIISDNNLYQDSTGIEINKCNNSSIIGNNIHNNTNFGVAFDDSVNLNITKNKINQSNSGIYGYFSSAFNIMNNQITNNSGEGIYLDDCYKGGLIESNNIYSNGCGVEVWEDPYFVYYNNYNLKFNRIVNNNGIGIFYIAYSNVNATLNWWGSNNASYVASQIKYAIKTGVVTYNPWIVLTITANPSSVGVSEKSNITSDLLHDSNGAYHNPTNGVVPYTGSANFTTTKGTITNTNYSNGATTSILNNLTTPGTTIVSSTVDHQKVSTNVTVYPTVTINNIINASNSVKTYYELHHILPLNVTVGNNTVSTSQFLYLLVTATLNINMNKFNPINIIPVNTAPTPSGTFTTGNLMKTEYLSVALNIQNFINTNNRTPNYASTSLGNIPFSKLVYNYSKVISFYGNNTQLPNYVTIT
jgi:parallel beta-helix repeat protein